MGAPDRNPDAILVPRPFFKDGRDPHQFFARKFKSVLGIEASKPLHTRAQNSQYFLTADPHDSLLFGAMDPHAGVERYEWYAVAEDASLVFLAAPEPVRSYQDRPGAVKFGWLRDMQDVPEPDVDVKAAFLKQVQHSGLKYKQSVDRYQALKAREQSKEQPLGQEERAELGRLAAELERTAREGPGRVTTDRTA